MSERFLISSPYWKHKGIFLCSLLWEAGRAPGGKSHSTVGVRLWLGPLEVLALKELSE